MLSQIDPKLIAAAVSFLVGVADALRRYRRDGDLKLRQLPLVELRAIAGYLRRRFFTIAKPSASSFVADITVDELERVLGRQGVKPDHPFSYVYEGEVYNGVMYYFDVEEKYPHRQIHVRAFPHSDGIEVMAHEEPHWYHHPVAHLRSDDMAHGAANLWVRERLENPAHVGFPAE